MKPKQTSRGNWVRRECGCAFPSRAEAEMHDPRFCVEAAPTGGAILWAVLAVIVVVTGVTIVFIAC